MPASSFPLCMPASSFPLCMPASTSLLGMPASTSLLGMPASLMLCVPASLLLCVPAPLCAECYTAVEERQHSAQSAVPPSRRGTTLRRVLVSHRGEAPTLRRVVPAPPAVSRPCPSSSRPACLPVPHITAPRVHPCVHRRVPHIMYVNVVMPSVGCPACPLLPALGREECCTASLWLRRRTARKQCCEAL